MSAAVNTVKKVVEKAHQAVAPGADDELELRLPDGSIIEDDVDITLDEAVGAASPAGCTESTRSFYGQPVSAGKAAELCPPGSGGLLYHAQLLHDGEAKSKEEKREAKDILPDGTVRPRRPNLPVLASDFFASLVPLPDGRWIFSGVLNGWPALNCLELVSITTRQKRDVLHAKSQKTVRHWDAGFAAAPSMPPGHCSVRATLRAAPWTQFGYEPGVAGFVWWFYARRETPRMEFGERIVETITAPSEAEAQCTHIHLFSHRCGGGQPPTGPPRLLSMDAAVWMDDVARSAERAPLPTD